MSTFYAVNDDVLIALIQQARRRIVYIAPGLHLPVAAALIQRFAELEQFDFGAIHQAVWEKTRALTGAEWLFDFALVDEGQDLGTRSFEILTAVSQHVTVFMDHKQQLFENGADEQGILTAPF